MKAARVTRFGPSSAIAIEDLPRPEAGDGQLLVHVKAAGVGNWDALIRSGKAKLQSLPIILGSELSGIVESVGPKVSGFKTGDAVYGATNPQFSGGYAEYAVPFARMMAPKPKTLDFIEAASVPIVAVTAWQMLFEYAGAAAGQTVLILGGAGNVGAYAVQMAARAGLHVAATAGAADLDYVRVLGAEKVLDYRKQPSEQSLLDFDIVLDTVGGDTQRQSLRAVKPGGILVSSVSAVPDPGAVRTAFFYVDVTTARLNRITEQLDSGKVLVNVGTVLPLDQARVAHEMLEGPSHQRGKIVLAMREP